MALTMAHVALLDILANKIASIIKSMKNVPDLPEGEVQAILDKQDAEREVEIQKIIDRQ